MKRINLHQNLFNKKFIFGMFFLVAISINLSATDIYVSKAGNDASGTGTLGAPYLTIQKASNVAVAGDKVYVGAGIYREMVDLKADGVTYQPYNGESVTINGADLLTAWTLTSGTTYQTAMSWDVDAVWGANQVFSDGKMIELARWPNQTSADIIVPTNAFADNVTASGLVTTITDADFNEPDGRWVGGKIWINLSRKGYDGQGYTATITSTNLAAKTITFTYITPYNSNPVISDNAWGMGKDTEYFLYNPAPAGVAATGGVDALLSNGEWWKDGTTLYVKTPTGLAPSSTGTGTNVIEAKARHFAFWPSVTRAGYTIKGFTLFGCAITTDKSPVTNRHIVLEAAHDILIDGITAKYVSHQTEMTGYFQDPFYNWTGIVVRGRNNTIQNCNIQFSATSALSISGFGIKVLNNVIANTNYMCANSGALNTGFVCLDAEIGNNTIYNTTVMAINFKYSKNSNPNIPHIYRIHHNTIYDFLRRSGDSGAIDMVGEDLQWIRIDHNIIYNNTPLTYAMTHGIYLDFGGGANIDILRATVDHNIALGTPSPIFMNSARFVNVYNNVAISSINDVGIKYGNGSSQGTEVKVYNNICTLGIATMPKADMRNNISNYTLAGMPDLFVDAANRDFRLKPTATNAIDQGISLGEFDDVLIGLPDLGAIETGTFVDVTAPTVPAGLNAGSIVNSSLTLSWTAATDNSGGFVNYNIYQDGVLIGDTSATSFKVKELEGFTTYVFTVKSKDNRGNLSAASAPLNITTISTSTVHIEAESKTTSSGGSLNSVGAWGNLKTGVYLKYEGVKLSGQDGFKARLSCTKESVQLEVRLNNSTGPLLGTLNVTSTGAYTTYTEQVGSLVNVPIGTFDLVLVAVNPLVASFYLDWFELSDAQAPTAPTGLVASAISANAFALNWTASNDNMAVMGYEVYEGATLIGKSKGTTINIKGLTAATNYGFTVKSVDTSGNKSNSSELLSVSTTNTVDVTVPAVPTSLLVTEITGTGFRLNWTAATDNIGIGGYEAYSGANLIGSSIGTAATMLITELAGATNYMVSLKAIDVAGNKSVASTELSVNTLDNIAPTAPTALSASTFTNSSVTLNWTASTDNTGVTGYEAYSGTTLLGSSVGTGTSMNVTGLTSATMYVITLKAKDAVGNLSLPSASVTISRTGIVTAAGEKAPSEAKEKAFDADILTKWFHKSTTSWIQIQYASALAYNQYEIVSGNDMPLRDPKNWTLQGSNNGTSWTILDTQTNQTWVGRMQTNTYIFANSTPYTYYKLDITANGGTTDIQLSEIIFINDNSAPTIPGALKASMLTAESFLLSWDFSTDNIAVIGYDIFKDDVLIGSTTTSINWLITGLNPNTTSIMTVKAKDAAGNFSPASLPLSVTTLNSTGIKELETAWFSVYGKDGQIVADLAGVVGESIVKIIDLRGMILKTIKTNDSLLTISFPNKGIYLVQVQNAGKSYTQKVVLF